MTFLIIFLAAYLIGSIPFGLILVKLAGKGDIRQIGSGNIGATNVLRTGDKKLAALTLLLDGGKGAVAVFLGSYFGANCFCEIGGGDSYRVIYASIAAIGVIFGHMFPVWLKFRGGKGVATALGVFFALCWPVGIVACGTWFLAAVFFRYSSLAAVLSMLITAGFVLLSVSHGWFNLVSHETMINSGSEISSGSRHEVNVLSSKVIALFIISILVILRHHANIRRLLTGTEPKIGKTHAAP